MNENHTCPRRPWSTIEGSDRCIRDWWYRNDLDVPLMVVDIAAPSANSGRNAIVESGS